MQKRGGTRKEESEEKEKKLKKGYQQLSEQISVKHHRNILSFQKGA